ncbi:MAG: hypothetical protein JWQ09_216 [Segetibacter sp.]|nr:hypothetical protein [Segetibacter sp.]
MRDFVETNSNRVTVDNVRVNRILEIINHKPTKVLCLMHSKVVKAFQEADLISRKVEYGLVGKYKKTLIYEVPFHNASIGDKKSYYSILRTAIS